MARRNRKFFFDNVRGKLIKNTTNTVAQNANEGYKVNDFASDAIIHSTGSFSNVNTKMMTAAAIDDRIIVRTNELVDSAPETLNTLNELAAALGDDANYSTTTSTALGNRLRIDVNDQSLTTTQKSNAVTNLGLDTVSTTGAYSDLTGTPTIPTNNNELTNGAGYITGYTVTESDVTGHQAALSITESQISDLGSYSTFSGAYADLTGKPTIPTNNNQLTNGAGYITSADGGNATTLDGIDSGSFLRSDATDTQTNTINMNGYFVGGADGHREKGIYGNYNSYRINNIWSMGTSYKVSSAGTDFGNLYGMAYTYSNRVYTSNSMGGNHQGVWCINGVPKCAFGTNLWTSGNVTAYSDIRVKENLEIIPNALEKVKKLNGYTFDRTDIEIDNEGNTARKRQTGVVAQEVLKVLPEVVTGNEDNPDGHLSVAYGNMVGLLIEAIKEQQQQIEEMRGMLDASSN